MRNLMAFRSWKQIVVFIFAVAVSAALLFVVLSGTEGTRASAQTEDTPTPAPTATPEGSGTDVDVTPPEVKSNAPKYGNMDSILNDLVEQVESGFANAHSAASSAPISDDESVAVAVFVEEAHLDSVTEYLNESGASVRFAEVDSIEAYVPVTMLGNLSQQEGVINVSTIIPPQAAQETLTSPAVSLHGADIWHLAGVKGEGMKIGIIDTGFRGFQDLMGLELPAAEQVRALCFTDLGTVTSDIEDCEIDSFHGSAVTEAAYDIAPEATYYIANPASWGDLRFATRWMASEGVDVINHSVGWIWSGPGDGSTYSIISPLNTVNLAVATNMTWVNAAGNGAEETWSGAYSDPDGNGVHNFTDEDECNDVQLGADEDFIGQLRWEDNWHPGDPESDLDIWLVNKDTGERVAASDSFQPEFPLPREVFIFTAEEKAVYCLSVRHYSGETPDWIQLNAFSKQDLEYATAAGSIGTPAESGNPGLLAVGASWVYDPTEIETFSSQGPVTPDVDTIKPDVVGANGAYSVVYARSFFGTSQASPHVAGMATLAKQLNLDSNAVDIANYIRSNTVDLGDEGPDYTWGYGFARLPAADVPYDPCLEDLGEIDDSDEFEIEGIWTEDCVSDRPAGQSSVDRFALYYTFEITEDSNVSISLTSDEEDTYLYLTEGFGRGGGLKYENDDVAPGSNTDSLIEVEDLSAGKYTIEATTFDAGVTGSFTLTLSVEATSRLPDPRVGGFIEVSYGSDHACGLNVNGTITCWGSNEHGKATPPEGRFKSVSTGDHGACAIQREDSTVVCWGIFSVGP